MNIKEATIHELKKTARTSGQGSVTTNLRPTPLPIDDTLKNLCSDLLILYAKVINSNGTLGKDVDTHIFPVRLEEYSKKEIDFQAFTISAVQLIAKQMEASIFSNGGYALFLRYEEDESDFLLIAMLKIKAGAGIEEKTLSLQKTLTVDLGFLHEAARINLSRWHNSDEPYLTFIKGKATQGDVTEYFRKALACLNFTSSSHHTNQVIKAADDFIESLAAPQEEKAEKRVQMRKRLHDCFVANSEEVSFLTIAAVVSPKDPQEFSDFVRTGPQAHNYTINEKFKPDKNIYKKMRRISGRIGKSISVAFDVSDIQAKSVYYDDALDALVLKSPPEHLKQAVQENAPK